MAKSRSSNAQAKARTVSVFEPQCYKILEDLSQKFKFAYGALYPAIDQETLPDYPLRVPFPLSFSEIVSKLDAQSYQTPTEWATDVRRVMGNCLRYNYNAKLNGSIRSGVKQMLWKFESDFSKIFPHETQALPELKDVVKVIEELSKVTIENTNALLVFSFMDPIQAYYDGIFPEYYEEIVEAPMCVGTILSNTIECVYYSLQECKDDFSLIATNCEKYCLALAEKMGNAFLAAPEVELIRNANTLVEGFVTGLEKELLKKPVLHVQNEVIPAAASRPGSRTQKLTREKDVIKKERELEMEREKEAQRLAKEREKEEKKLAQQQAQLSMEAATQWLQERMKRIIPIVKKHHLQGVKKVQTCFPFKDDVNPAIFPDYYEFIETPISLATMEKKMKTGEYVSLLDLAQDLRLMRSNAHQFNVGDENVEVRIMADTVLEVAIGVMRRIVSEVEEAGDQWLLEAVYRGPQYHSYPCIDAEYDFPDIGSLLEKPEPEPITQFLAANQLPLLPLFQPPVATASPPTTGKKKQATSQGVQKTKPPAKKPKVEIEMSQEEIDYIEGGDEEYDYLDPNDEYKAEEDIPIEEDDFRPEDFEAEIEAEMAYEEYSERPKAKARNKTNKSGSRAKKSSIYDDYDEDDIIYYEKEMPKSLPVYQYDMTGVQLRDFEKQVDSCLSRLEKHDWVKTEKVSNFYRPVVEVYPEIAADYQSVVKYPMDLSTVRHNLYMEYYSEPESPVNDICRVFQNAIDYNRTTINYEVDDRDDDHARGLIEKCEHLLRYTKWIALEGIDLDEDDLLLNNINRDLERNYRMDVLRGSNLQQWPGECTRLLRRLEANNKKEIEFFRYLVDTNLVKDYLAYVKVPISYNVIKENLENHVYTNYASFVDDLRLLFENGKAYNAVHSEIDPISKKVYEVSCHFLDKLENLVFTDFSIVLCDKIAVRDLLVSQERRQYARMGITYVERAQPAPKKKNNAAFADFSFTTGADLDSDDDQKKYDDDEEDAYKHEEEVVDEDDFDDGEEYEEEEEVGDEEDGGGRRGRSSHGGRNRFRTHVTARGVDAGFAYGRGFDQLGDEEPEDADVDDAMVMDGYDEVLGNGVVDETVVEPVLSLNVGITDAYKEQKRKLFKRRVIDKAWEKWGHTAITQETDYKEQLEKAMTRSKMRIKNMSSVENMGSDVNIMGSEPKEMDVVNSPNQKEGDVETISDNTLSPNIEGGGISMNFARRSPVRRLIKSCLVAIDDDEQLEDAFSRCTAAVSRHINPNESYAQESESGITDFSHQRVFSVPEDCLSEVQVCVGQGYANGEKDYVPVISHSRVFYSSSCFEESFVALLQIYLPCLEWDGEMVLEGYDDEDDLNDYAEPGSRLGTPVRWRYLEAGGSSSSTSRLLKSETKVVEIGVHGWCVRVTLTGANKSSVSAMAAGNENLNLLTQTSINGHTELHPFKGGEGADKIIVSSTDNDMYYSLFSISSEETERVISANLQCVGSSILCSQRSETVIASLSGRRKGKFRVLNLLLPISCGVSISYGSIDNMSDADVDRVGSVWPRGISTLEHTVKSEDAFNNGFDVLGIKKII